MTGQVPVTILGTGNVARALGSAFVAAGNPITQIWGRNQEKTIQLAAELGTSAVVDIRQLQQHEGLFLVTVSDDAIEMVANQMPGVQGVVAHTSGSTRLKALSERFAHSGVLYPLQTFSRLNPPDISRVPFIIQGSDDWSLGKLKSAVSVLGGKVAMLSEEQRIQIHLTAVMLNNFCNHLVTLADDYMHNHGLPPMLMYPLLEQTIQNAVHHHARLVQTGPAKRGDQHTINTHLAMLGNEENPFLEQLYRLFSDSIRTYYAQSK